MSNLIGITEGADPTINLRWQKWVKTKPAILITKRPDKIISMLSGEENIIIHCTITGLGGTLYEPDIPLYPIEIESYHELCKIFGKDRIVLRIDPIISPSYLDRVKSIKEEAEGRVRISFLDLYPHIERRLKDRNIEILQDNFHQELKQRVTIWEELGKPEICGEPGMEVTPCVSEKDCEILNIKPSNKGGFQRSYCACLGNKYELCNPPPKCSYGCLYCYWK